MHIDDKIIFTVCDQCYEIAHRFQPLIMGIIDGINHILLTDPYCYEQNNILYYEGYNQGINLEQKFTDNEIVDNYRLFLLSLEYGIVTAYYQLNLDESCYSNCKICYDDLNEINHIMFNSTFNWYCKVPICNYVNTIEEYISDME
jgi:hypothetical protein